MGLFDTTTQAQKLAAQFGPVPVLGDLDEAAQWQRVLDLVNLNANETALNLKEVALLDHVFGPGRAQTIEARAAESKRKFSHAVVMVDGMLRSSLLPFDPDYVDPDAFTASEALERYGFAALLACVDAGVQA